MKKLLIIFSFFLFATVLQAQNEFTASFTKADEAFYKQKADNNFLNNGRKELSDMNMLVSPVQKISMFKPVPKTLFTETPGVLNAPQNASVWLWRLNANLVADELVWDKDTKQFTSVPLSGMGPGIGYHHFTELQDGTPFNDWGVNFLVLIGTDIEHVTPANLKAALTVNAFDIFNIGVDTNLKTVGILFGVSVSFQ